MFPFYPQRPRGYHAPYPGYRRYDHGMDDLDRRMRNLRLSERGCRRRSRSDPLHRATQFVGRGLRGARRRVTNRIKGNIQIPGYSILKSLTPGGMSESVLQVQKKTTGKVFIAKRISANGNLRARALAELETLRRIPRGQNLSYMVEHFWDPNRMHLTLILEYCDVENLDQTIAKKRRRRESISEGFVWHVVLSMARALSFLHCGIRQDGSRPAPGWDTICHLDIKPNNVFLTSDGRTNVQSRIVLGDFGLAVFKSDISAGRVRGSPGGTSGWIAPECELGGYSYVTAAADIWQLGGLCQALARFAAAPERSRPGRNVSLPRSYSSRLSQLVGKMSAHRYSDRPSSRDIVAYVKRHRS